MFLKMCIPLFTSSSKWDCSLTQVRRKKRCFAITVLTSVKTELGIWCVPWGKNMSFALQTSKKFVILGVYRVHVFQFASWWTVLFMETELFWVYFFSFYWPIESNKTQIKIIILSFLTYNTYQPILEIKCQQNTCHVCIRVK